MHDLPSTGARSEPAPRASRGTAPRVLVAGASPDRLNRNAVLRSFVVEGFAEVLGRENAREARVELAARAVEQWRPDLVVSFGSCMPDESDYSALRRACDRTGAILAFWLHDDPYEFDFHYRAARVADFLFSNDRWAALHMDHPRAAHLPLAASPTAHFRQRPARRRFDVFFCGVAFENRKHVVSDLADTLRRVNTLVTGSDWPTKSLPFAQDRHLSNEEVADGCAASLLVLNLGRSLHFANDRYRLDPSTPGPRTFEAAMAGAAQAYFATGLEICEYYEPGSEVFLFDSPRDFAGLVDSLLAEPDRAAAVGLAAQRRTLRDHTYARRAERILRTCLGFEPDAGGADRPAASVDAGA